MQCIELSVRQWLAPSQRLIGYQSSEDMAYLPRVTRVQSWASGLALFAVSFAVVRCAPPLRLSWHFHAFPDITIFVATSALSFPLHELAHGLGFTWGGVGVKHIRFGWSLRPFQLRTAVRTELPLWRFRVGMLLPAVLFGVGPALCGTICDYPIVALVGVAHLAGCGTDLVVASNTRSLAGSTTIAMDDQGFLAKEDEATSK